QNNNHPTPIGIAYFGIETRTGYAWCKFWDQWTNGKVNYYCAFLIHRSRVFQETISILTLVMPCLGWLWNVLRVFHIFNCCSKKYLLLCTWIILFFRSPEIR